jgi:hypothetical protein
MKKQLDKRKQAKSGRDPRPYPKGWSRKRVQTQIDHNEGPSDEDAIAEAEAAYKAGASAMIQLPIELVPPGAATPGKASRLSLAPSILICVHRWPLPSPPASSSGH